MTLTVDTVFSNASFYAHKDWSAINREPLIVAHAALHIAFWGVFALAHVAVMIHKRLVAEDPYLLPGDTRFFKYLLFQHALDVMDIAALVMGIVHVSSHGGMPYAAGDTVVHNIHRIGGIILLPLSLFQRVLPVVFAYCTANARHQQILKMVHNYFGMVLLLYVLGFQLWSGVDLIGWGIVAYFALYTWIGVWTLMILVVYAYGVCRVIRRTIALKRLYYKPLDREQLLRVIDPAEVAKHNTLEDMWMSVNGLVMDCSQFKADHPGGALVLLKFAGKDASETWSLNHPGDYIERYTPGLVVGMLPGTKVPEWLGDRGTQRSAPVYRPRIRDPVVVVVGGGLAGLTACHAALACGSKVILLDKMKFCGGNSVKAASGINGAGTRVQAHLGIRDTWESFAKDTYISYAGGSESASEYPLGTVLTSQSASAIHWLMDSFLVPFTQVTRLGGHSCPRTHRGDAMLPGMMITARLLNALAVIADTKDGPVQIINEARATELLKNAAGDVTGVRYECPEGQFTAKGVVVLATGGWAADFTKSSLLARFRPDLLNFPTTNGEHCTGDGVKMAEAVGAGLVQLDRVQIHPTGLVDPDNPNSKFKVLGAEAMRGVGGILLNSKGKRFCNEMGRRDYVSGRMLAQKDSGPFYLVLNAQSVAELKWHIDSYMAMGLMVKVSSGRALAQHLQLQEEVVATLFNDYQRAAEDGKDTFGTTELKNANAFNMMGEFYVCTVAPVVHYCMGGIAIDAMAQVLDRRKNQKIAGLYASGECAGGIHGANRLAGSSLLDCVVFGRIAGQNAARYLQQLPEASPA